jgi:hypothetical protein
MYPAPEVEKAPTKREVRAEFADRVWRNIENNLMKQYEKKKALRKQS